MKLKLDLSYLAAIYQMAGRDAVKRMLTIPGGVLTAENRYWKYAARIITFLPRDVAKRILFTVPGGPLIDRAKKNKDEPQEIIDKRDAVAESLMLLVEAYSSGNLVENASESAAESVLNLIEEYANLDED